MTGLNEDESMLSINNERLHRRELVLAYFPKENRLPGQGLDSEILVDVVETIHGKLAELGPQGMRDSQNLEVLKSGIVNELPQLKSPIEGSGGDIYDLLLSVAKGVVNTSIAPLSAYRLVSGT